MHYGTDKKIIALILLGIAPKGVAIWKIVKDSSKVHLSKALNVTNYMKKNIS